MVLGKGGASRAVQFALEKLGVPVKLVSRNDVPAFDQLDLNPYDLIVNCTPVGTLNSDEKMDVILPLNYASVRKGQIFFDLIYNPSKTEMMKVFQHHGANVLNGKEMLYLQADKAWEIIRTFQ